VITLICILGVMLGVSVLIIVIAVMTGFDNKFRDSLIGFQAHLKVEQRAPSMTNWNAVMNRLDRDPAVRGVAPYIDTQVLIKSEPANGAVRKLARSSAGFIRSWKPT
jgi:lipoprotein-releasing system permease protein